MSRSLFLRGCLAIFPLVLGFSSADAAVVYYTANATTPVGTAFDDSGVWFDFFSGNVTTRTSNSGYLPGKAGQYQLNFDSANGYTRFTAEVASTSAMWTNNTFNGVERLGSGRSVDSASVYTWQFTIMASIDPYANEWDGLGRGYIGVTFSDDASNVYYGYVDVTVNGDYTATLNGFAYENSPGVAILTGAVPEPSVLGLSAAGLLLMNIRRRKLI